MKNKTKQTTELLEDFYNFCGHFDKLLQKDYKRNKIAEKGATFPQFCAVMYEQFMCEAQALNIVSKKRK